MLMKKIIMLCFLGLIVLSNSLGQDQEGTIFLTMEEAISRALSQNNMIRASEYGLKKAHWDRVNAWTQFLPNVSFNTMKLLGIFSRNHSTIAR